MENRRASYRFRIQPGCEQATLVRSEGQSLAVQIVDESATGALVAFANKVPVDAGETVWLQNAKGWREAEVSRIDEQKRRAGLVILSEISEESSPDQSPNTTANTACAPPPTTNSLQHGLAFVAAVGLGVTALLLSLRWINTPGAMPIVRSHAGESRASLGGVIDRRHPHAAETIHDARPLAARPLAARPDSHRAAKVPSNQPIFGKQLEGGSTAEAARIQSQIDRFMQGKLDDLQIVREMSELNLIQLSEGQNSAVADFLNMVAKSPSPPFVLVQDTHRAVFESFGEAQKRKFKAYTSREQPRTASQP